MSELADLLERYRRGPDLVAAAVAGAAGAELDYTPGPGRWSIRQIACHLADSELVNAVRFRRVIAEDNPALPGYDQEIWAGNLHYSERAASITLEVVRCVCADSFQLLQALPEAAFARTGDHSEEGRVSLLYLVRSCAEHTEKHSRQILAVRKQR